MVDPIDVFKDEIHQQEDIPDNLMPKLPSSTKTKFGPPNQNTSTYPDRAPQIADGEIEMGLSVTKEIV